MGTSIVLDYQQKTKILCWQIKTNKLKFKWNISYLFLTLIYLATTTILSSWDIGLSAASTSPHSLDRDNKDKPLEHFQSLLLLSEL